MLDRRLSSKIFQKLGNGIDASDQQVIAGTCASDVQKMPFGVVQVFKVGMITNGSANRRLFSFLHRAITPSPATIQDIQHPDC